MASTISAGTTTTTSLSFSGDTSGVLQLQTNGTTTAVTIDTSQNVGIGISPSQKLSVLNSASVTGGHSGTLTSGSYFYLRGDSGSSSGQGSIFQINANYGLDTWIYNTNTSAFITATTLDVNGNLGLGVTPSAWSNFKAIQMTNGVGLASYTAGAVIMNLGANQYYNGSNYVYVNSDYSTSYQQTSGVHKWWIAPSGTAGATITETQAMLLDNSGNLTISGSTATKASGTTWANPSDTRLKNNQALYTKGLTELNQIKVKTWIYNGLGGSVNGQVGIGVIADEAMTVLPDTVDTYSAKLNPTDTEETDIKRFNASEVIWLLVTSLQELDAKFESYKATHP